MDTVEVALLSGHRDLGYSMERFYELAGIYYDSLGKATYYTPDWQTTVYLSLRPITTQITMIENFIARVLDGLKEMQCYFEFCN